MGLHNSSLTVGVALGAPLAGVVMDTFTPAWGFAAVGGVGLAVAVLVFPIELRRRRKKAEEVPPLGSADVLGAGAAGPATEVPATQPH